MSLPYSTYSDVFEHGNYKTVLLNIKGREDQNNDDSSLQPKPLLIGTPVAFVTRRWRFSGGIVASWLHDAKLFLLSVD